MSTTQPIRSKAELQRFKNYFQTCSPNPRNNLLIVFGLNTALRISDILSIKWEDVFAFDKGVFRTHLLVNEQKTGKDARIYLNKNIKDALRLSMKETAPLPENYLFSSSKCKERPISRIQAYRIIRRAAEDCGIDGTVSCHSLRKTFGYHAWKQGTSSVLLMNIYNHSSFQVTKRYLGIEQDEKDSVYKTICL